MKFLRHLVLVAWLAWTLVVPAQDASPAPPTPPAAEAPAEAPKSEDIADTEAADEAEPMDQTPEEEEKPAKPRIKKRRANSHEVLKVGQNVTIGPNDSVETVVVVGGNATINGHVESDVVVVGGRLTINGSVGGNAVNVGTGIRLGTNAVVDGDAVGIGGGIEKDEGATIGGEEVPVGIPGLGELKIPESLRRYFTDCVLKVRPLSFTTWWPWGIFGAIFVLHLGFAVLVPGAASATERSLIDRPFDAAVVAVLLLPVAFLLFVILSFTGIGPILVLIALFVAAVIGKIGVLQLLGNRLVSLTGATRPLPLVGFLLGSVIATLLYATPYIGLLVWVLLTLWGMGGVTLLVLQRKPAPTGGPGPGPSGPAARPASGLASTPSPGVVTLASVTPGATEPVPDGPSPAMAGQMQTQSPAASMATVTPVDLVMDPAAVAGLPRPGFSRRAGAVAIDWVAIAAVFALLPFLQKMPGILKLLLVMAYFSGMWLWRGTTLGGLVCGISVVRTDGRPLNRATAAVRAASAILSAAVCFLGWLWALWDPERQTWHDKLAGTAVVQVPRSQSLV
jgi:uncharacterized RDD family membrane protein YckC